MIFAGWSLVARVAAPLIVLGVLAAGVWAYGHRQYRAGLDAGKAEVKQEWAAAIDEANMRAAQAGHRYEEWKLLQRPKVITRTVEVERAIEADPSWAAARLPDGVRQSIEAAAADILAGEPGRAVPAVRAAEGGDE